LQHGVAFQPVNIRTTKDPLSLIGRILDQNPRSYTKLDDLVAIGENLVKAGLASGKSQGLISTSEKEGTASSQDPDEQLSNSSNRITSMAIEAALSENDFDTAYSYIINRLSPTSSAADPNPAQTTEDDASWRAAFLAGRFSSQTKPTTSPPSLRRLEQRLELLSLALLLAPSSQLPEILTVWRAVEAALTALLAREAAEEDTWNTKADRGGLSGSTALPGGFGPPSMVEIDRAANQQRPRRQSRTAAMAANEEAPMGLFDVARGAAQAFRKNAFPVNAAAATASPTGSRAKGGRPLSMVSDDSLGGGSSEGEGKERVRKRDLVANAVTGGLASGIGWVIGAPSSGARS
ncbi:MAG: hypothetical protein Q9218_006694, partial [Villophora microphyllina]